MLKFAPFAWFPHGSRNMAISSGVKAEESRRSDRRRLIPSANDPIHATRVDKHFPITRGMDNEENRAAMEEFIVRYDYACPAHIEDGSKIFDAMYDAEDVRRAAVEVTDGKQDPMGPVKDLTGGQEDARGQGASEVSDDAEYEEVTSDPDDLPCDVFGRVLALPESSHRDGSIYRDNYHWKEEFCIANRSETRLEAMMLSDPSKFSGAQISCEPCSLWQIFSLKVTKIPVNSGSVELYGYIAARDDVDPLLNYAVNISRDDPVIVEQGSLIEMTGPKRGIELSCTVLLEYDMRIKIGDQEKDDLQLIDGV